MTGGHVGLFTTGMWAQRARIAALTGLAPTRRWFSARGLAAVADWGHKPTAARARRAAAAAGAPYLAIEDGFLRSVRPGGGEPPASLVCDAVGVYYDAGGPNQLERLIAARAADTGAATAAAPAFSAIRELGLSKYNDFAAPAHAAAALAPLERCPGGAALIVDQTLGDAAVDGALAGCDTRLDATAAQARFADMLIAAAVENPAALLVVKVHPETLSGRRRGHFDPAMLAAAATRSPALAAAAAQGRLMLFDRPVAPVDLLARTRAVYVLSSLLGFEALIAGLPVICFGRAFYAGWGLTDDRGAAFSPDHRRPAPLPALVAAAFVDYARYFHPDTGAPCALEQAAAQLVRRRPHPPLACGRP